MSSSNDNMSIDTHGTEDLMDTSSRPSSKKMKTKHPGPRQRSHVYEYFKETTAGYQCQVQGVDGIYGHIIKEGGTITNRARHLTISHKILSPQEKEKVIIIILNLNSIN